MSSKRGFTLIELLAVILIFGIIALIAIPTITGVIEDSKKGSLKSTASILADAAERQCQIEQMHGNEITKFYNISDGIISSPLDIKNIPNSGSITVDDECNANVAIANNEYCAVKTGNVVTVNSDVNKCTIDPNEIPLTKDDCFIFDEASHTITGYNYEDTTCPTDISIPATINSIPVEHIADFAFVNADYNYMYAYGYNSYSDNTNEVEYISYGTNFDLLNNINRYFSNIGYYRFVNSMNATLKKQCYSLNGNYEEKEYNYVITDSDTYIACAFTTSYDDTEYSGLSSITGVDFSKAINLITIGNGAFEKSQIQKIKFGSLPKLASLGVSSFYGNQITGELDLSGLTGLNRIDNDSFNENFISNIIFPNNLKEVGFFSFANNDIVAVDFPSSLTLINYGAFQNNNIKSLNITDNIIHVLDYAFFNNDIDNLVLNDNIQDIYYSSYGSNQISEINLPDNLLTIEGEAFYNNLISSIEIPNTLKYLDGFEYNNINVLNIPNSDIYIGGYAFYSNNISSLNLGTGVTGIGSYAFGSGKNTISSVVIPNSLTDISDYLFDSTKITNLTIGDNVTSIGNYSFNKSNIYTINWGTTNKLKTIGNSTFIGIKVNSIDIPSGVTSIGNGTFLYSIATTINIPDSVSTIGYSAFSGDPKLETTNIGSGITKIGSNAFACYNGQDICGKSIININRKPTGVAGSPWGNSYATINWTGTN